MGWKKVIKKRENKEWKKRVVSPEEALAKIRPGMNIFLGTGVAEPRTLVKELMASTAANLQDLTLIQLLSFGDTLSLEALKSNKYRLKTFFSGWVASESISAGRVDLIPSRFSAIPRLIRDRHIPVDAAFIQITEPDENGHCSLGVAVDVARKVMARASLVMGEINPMMPRTYGDTFVGIDEFDLLVAGNKPVIHVPPSPTDKVFDQVAANVASVIEDGSCLAYSFGPLFEALTPYLMEKKDLGLHTPFVTDAVMTLMKSGAVTNRRKGCFKGKTLASYAMGTEALMHWLDQNPLVEFQGVQKVFSPMEIGKNPRFVAVFPARRVDLACCIAMHIGAGNVTSGPGQAMDFFNGAEVSQGGFTIFALPSRNLKGEGNILLSIEGLPNQINLPESVDMIATEYGIASLRGRTVRERAQSLIEIAHPDDRPFLVKQAKEASILYSDQIFLGESSHCYPQEIDEVHTFNKGVTLRFRAIKPSDEEEMRRLFYRFSDEAIYYRYFAAIKTMPHARMQAYVNVDYLNELSVVGLAGPPGQGRIVAEARYARHRDKPYVDVAFVVDEAYQGMGVATFLYRMLTRLALQRGARGMTADVLSSNQAMIKVFEKGGYPVQTHLEQGSYCLTIPFDSEET